MSRKTRNTVIRIALLMVLALIACLISGCSQNDAPKATEAPTEIQTEVPTEVPTEEPTEVPTEAPTGEPTEAPTEAPTGEPAEEPTEAPAEEPTEAPAGETTEVPAEAATETKAPVLLVTVDGEEIWSDNAELMNEYQYYLDLAESYDMDTSSEEVQAFLRPYAMEGMINTVLVNKKAAELGLDQISDEETAQFRESIQASWEEAVQYFIDTMGEVTETSTDDEKAAARADALAYIKENYGYEEEPYINECLKNEIFRTVLERVQAHVVGDSKVSDEEIQNHFDGLVDSDKESYENDVGSYEYYSQYFGQPSYYTPEGYRGIIHILLKVDDELMNAWKDLSARLEEQQSDSDAEPTETEEPAESAEPADTPESADTSEPTDTPEPTAEPVTQEMVDAAEKAILDSVKDTVDEIKAKLESGASFTDLIKEYGTDPGMQDESTLAKGYMVHKDSILWDPAFKKAALALEKAGDISEPFVGQYGVHILQYLKDIPGGAVELTDEMKEEFRSTLQDELEENLFQTALNEWRAAAKIEYTEAGEAWKMIPEEPEAEAEEAPAEEAPAEEAPAE